MLGCFIPSLQQAKAFASKKGFLQMLRYNAFHSWRKKCMHQSQDCVRSRQLPYFVYKY